MALPSPATPRGRPIRTCFFNIFEAIFGMPASWHAPPVNTARRPAILSSPLAKSCERTISSISSTRGNQYQ